MIPLGKAVVPKRDGRDKPRGLRKMDATTATAPKKQHLIDPEICIRCNPCEETCPVDAVTHDDNNYVVDVGVPETTELKLPSASAMKPDAPPPSVAPPQTIPTNPAASALPRQSDTPKVRTEKKSEIHRDAAPKSASSESGVPHGPSKPAAGQIAATPAAPAPRQTVAPARCPRTAAASPPGTAPGCETADSDGWGRSPSA